jgi:hypothetical protein
MVQAICQNNSTLLVMKIRVGIPAQRINTLVDLFRSSEAAFKTVLTAYQLHPFQSTRINLPLLL